MEELIKEANWLYFQIENTQEKLVKSRLRDEKDNEHTALIELETEMCATLQLLKCIIDRKGSIVELGEVWHNVDEEPDGLRNILIDSSNYLCNTSSSYVCDTISPLLYDGKWKYIVNKLNIKRWAYIENLLPKGVSNE